MSNLSDPSDFSDLPDMSDLTDLLLFPVIAIGKPSLHHLLPYAAVF